MPKKKDDPQVAPARNDLVDNGEFRMPTRKPAAVERPAPIFLGEGVAAPTQSGAVTVEAYDAGGRPTLAEGAARRDKFRGRDLYYARVSAFGKKVGGLFDPHAVDATEGELDRFDKRRGQHAYQFREITRAGFESYIKYLRKGDKTDLARAQKGVDDA